MNSYSIKPRKLLVTCCGAALAMGLFAFRAQGDTWDKKTYLTVDKTIQVTDRVLPAGTYVLRLADSNANRHIVQIFNQDQTQIIDTVLAIPNYRLRPTGRSQFLFWETPAGAAPALRAWFYPGDNFGQEFAYPKQIAMLHTTTASERTRIMNQEMETRTETKTESTGAADRMVETTPEAAPAPEVSEAQPAEEPVEMAQATPPPAPAAEPPAPAAQTPSELPRTASPYPFIGLAGMLSLCLYGALRFLRA